MTMKKCSRVKFPNTFTFRATHMLQLSRKEIGMAKKQVAPPMGVIAILLGAIIGAILTYAYQMNLPTSFYETNAASLVVFVAIPLITGFIVGLLSPANAFRNSLFAGALVGLFNSVLGGINLIYATTLREGEVYAFALFAIVAVFIWALLAAIAAWLGQKVYE